jgi:hypothetical protein
MKLMMASNPRPLFAYIRFEHHSERNEKKLDDRQHPPAKDFKEYIPTSVFPPKSQITSIA